ncbi:MAG: hypothetical protein ACK5JE_10125 [Castellaniella sp.]|uniref:hypothetical protein n=1 Tax=Castellaniella sp. TaxID=1955812 RepID=UPI003A8B0831
MKKSFFAAALFAGALMAGPTAQAGDVDVGISIGIPGFFWGGPAYYPPPPPPPRRVYRPRVVVVPGPGYYRHGWTNHRHDDRAQRKYGKDGWKQNRGGHRGRGWDD